MSYINIQYIYIYILIYIYIYIYIYSSYIDLSTFINVNSTLAEWHILHPLSFETHNETWTSPECWSASGCVWWPPVAAVAAASHASHPTSHWERRVRRLQLARPNGHTALHHLTQLAAWDATDASCKLGSPAVPNCPAPIIRMLVYLPRNRNPSNISGARNSKIVKKVHTLAKLMRLSENWVPSKLMVNRHVSLKRLPLCPVFLDTPEWRFPQISSKNAGHIHRCMAVSTSSFSKRSSPIRSIWSTCHLGMGQNPGTPGEPQNS